MKRLLRDTVFHIVSLWLASQLLPALFIVGSWQTITFAGLVLTILNYIVKPLLKILFIPLNLITFGLFSWLIHVAMLYLLTLFVPEIQIHPWTFSGATWAGFVIPAFHFTYLTGLVAASLLIAIIAQTLHNLTAE